MNVTYVATVFFRRQRQFFRLADSFDNIVGSSTMVTTHIFARHVCSGLIRCTRMINTLFQTNRSR